MIISTWLNYFISTWLKFLCQSLVAQIWLCTLNENEKFLLVNHKHSGEWRASRCTSETNKHCEPCSLLLARHISKYGTSIPERRISTVSYREKKAQDMTNSRVLQLRCERSNLPDIVCMHFSKQQMYGAIESTRRWNAWASSAHLQNNAFTRVKQFVSSFTLMILPLYSILRRE